MFKKILKYIKKIKISSNLSKKFKNIFYNIILHLKKILKFTIKIIKKIDKKIILKIVKYLVFLFLLFCIFIIGLFFYYTYDLPRPENFTEKQFFQSTKIYDRTGKILLYDIYGEEKREIVSFDKISQNLKNAVLASEDDGFYQHGGIDIKSLFRAILIDLKLQSKSQGASTITQQLIRSSFLTGQKTISRKIREAVLAIEIERRYSKDEIFNWYLNQIPFGENAYGVESASQTYFNKSALDISLSESAILTALIQAPSYYSPYGLNKEKLLIRKDYVLDRMVKTGFITKELAEKTKQEKIVFSEDTQNIKAPHFVMYVKKYLEEKYGEEFLKEKGLKVYTTLDWELQEFSEKVVADQEAFAKSVNAYNSSLVVIDPKTGEILTLMGSKDYFQKSFPEGCEEKPGAKCLFTPKFDVATMGLRQPGSSFKPIVYASSFKKGFTPETVLWDVKTEFNPNCSASADQIKDIYGLRCYHPYNYDENFRGKVSLRSAIAQSLNLPSVKLLYLTGLKESLQTARDLGITTLNEPERYGLSLVLGGGEVTLIELTSAYGVFATEGQKVAPVSILKIEDSNGKILEENKKSQTKVLDTNVSRQINSILSDNNARAPIFGYNSVLHFANYDVAVKTGTTESYKDAWTIGYTPFAVVGVWSGNNNNAPVSKKSGAGLAAPIWRKIMEKLLKSHKTENFTKPNSPQTTNPALLGQLPETDTNTILYYIDKNNVLESTSQNTKSDPQLFNWQQAINFYTGTQSQQQLIENPQPLIPISQ
jgi:1A family penicillin-binding protein